MKLNTIGLRIVFLTIFYVLVVNTGCSKENIINDLYPFKIYYVILNEQGIETNRIKEGNNFYIQFSIKNTSGKDVLITNHHSFANNELFNVYRLDNENNITIVENQAMQGICLDVGGCFKEADIKVPWVNERDTVIGLMCCNYELMKRKHLPIGKYMLQYTGNIEYDFTTGNSETDSSKTGNYNIKYEFEIIK